MFPTRLDRQRAIFQRPPRQLAADGGFASRENFRLAKGQGIKDVAFANLPPPGLYPVPAQARRLCHLFDCDFYMKRPWMN